MAGLALTVRRVGDIRKDLARVAQHEKHAATATVRRSGAALGVAVRRRVTQAGLGPRFAKAVREDTYPARGVATSPKTRVSSKALYKRPGGLVDLLTVFMEGAIVEPVTKRFLLIGARIARGALARLARARRVVIPPRLREVEADHKRIASTMPAIFAREYKGQFRRGA